MSSRKTQQDGNINSGLDKIEEATHEEDVEHSKEQEFQKAHLKNPNERDREEGINAEEEPKDNQYEFIMNVLQPYRKIIYKLIQLGYIRERTKFCKHSLKS